MIISTDLSFSIDIAARASHFSTGELSISLDNWPHAKFIQAVYQAGTGADASGLDYPEPVDDRKILSYGYGIAPHTPSEGFAVQAESRSLTIANLAVFLGPEENRSVVAFFIKNTSGQLSSKMKINGPARGCVSTHIGPFIGGSLVNAPDEQHPIEVAGGDSIEIGPEDGGADGTFRIFWIGTEHITGWPRDISSSIYVAMVPLIY